MLGKRLEFLVLLYGCQQPSYLLAGTPQRTRHRISYSHLNNTIERPWSDRALKNEFIERSQLKLSRHREIQQNRSALRSRGKTMSRYDGVPREILRVAQDQAFGGDTICRNIIRRHFNGTSVAPLSFFKGRSTLPAGHAIKVNSTGSLMYLRIPMNYKHPAVVRSFIHELRDFNSSLPVFHTSPGTQSCECRFVNLKLL